MQLKVVVGRPKESNPSENHDEGIIFAIAPPSYGSQLGEQDFLVSQPAVVVYNANAQARICDSIV
jgi:hypothetical protein